MRRSNLMPELRAAAVLYTRSLQLFTPKLLAHACAVAPHPGRHQRDRVGILDCGDGVPQRETLACGRPHRALGGIGPAGGRTSVPQSARLSRDPGATDGASEYGF